mgnify:CR=1 FL=1
MAVSVDTVYQRVLTLANKEQRGYITPQEFNLFANQAQIEIFEQYFHDVKKFNALPGNTQEFSDSLSVLYEKIGEFEVQENLAWMQANMPIVGNAMRIPWDIVYKIGTVTITAFTDNNRSPSAQTELLNFKDFGASMFSSLTAPSISRPTACINTGCLLVSIGKNTLVTHQTISSYNAAMAINFIARPKKVEWAYVIVNDKALRSEEHTSELQSPCNLVCRLLLEKKKKKEKEKKKKIQTANSANK